MLLHTTHSLSRHIGGVPVAILNLLDNLAICHPEQEWRLLAEPGHDSLLATHPHSGQWSLHALEEGVPGYCYIKALSKLLKGGRVQLIHDHGIWLPNNLCVARMARQRQIPRIISTHGMLEPWAWEYKAWKKRLAWRLFQHNDLSTASALHATSKHEAELLKKWFPQVPVAYIPLGVETSPLVQNNEKKGNELRQVLFLSRLHEKKGLLNLIQAWHQLNPKGWKLTIAGPDEKGYRSIIEAKIAQLTLSNVELVGPVEGLAKWELYRNADLFVLPTFSENFGIVIAEALSAGTPVITTKGAPWSDLVDYKCGWWVDVGVDPLVKALQEALRLPSDHLLKLGQRGQVLIDKKYTWPQVASKMLTLYQWIISSSSKPVFVI